MSDIRRAIEIFSKSTPAGSRILDVGCGLRPYEVYFTGCKYIGIDVPNSGRDASGKLPDYEFNGTKIPLDSEQFDVVICTEVLEHAVDPNALLIEMARVSRPGAMLFLTVPFIWGLHELPYDFRRFTTEGVRRSVEQAGFKVLTLEKLTPGVAAIHLLVLSEINNYVNNVISLTDKKKILFRLIFWFQGWLFRILIFIWRRNLRFERIYIDNLVLAQKQEFNLQQAPCAEGQETIISHSEVLSISAPFEFKNFIERKTRRQKIRLIYTTIKRLVHGSIKT